MASQARRSSSATRGDQVIKVTSIEQIEAERQERHQTAPQAPQSTSPSAWAVIKHAFSGGQPSGTQALQAPPPNLQALYQQQQREEDLRGRELAAAGLTTVERSPDRFKIYERKQKPKPAEGVTLAMRSLHVREDLQHAD